MPKVAVIGLGRFGTQLSRQLGASGVQVIAVDRSPHLVDDVKDDVDIAVRMDATDEHALDGQDIDKVDVCVIAIGENFEAALLTTVLVKKLGVPRIICRAQSQFHAEIFHQIGADEVIQPETQAGENLAHRLANPHLEDVVVLAEGYALIELPAPSVFCGKSLQELELRAKFGVNLVALKRPVAVDGQDDQGEAEPAESVISVPQPDEIIQTGDTMVVVGSAEALENLPRDRD